MNAIRLLLVDDEADFREATSKVLARRGFTTDQAASGPEALERIAAARPDVVLLDLRMEGMDGIATLEEIRKVEPGLPVIILTGHGQLDDAMAGIELDIVDFLHKPVDVEQLASHVRRVLERGEDRVLREKTIGELMVPVSSYERIYEDEPLSRAVACLRDAFFRKVEGKVTEQGHRSVLVYDRKERFVGLLHVHDVIGAVIPSYLHGNPYSSYFTGLFLAQVKMLGKLAVADLLDGELPVDVETPLMEAVHLLLERRTINLPISRAGEVVGILRDKDLLLEIAGAMNGG